MVDANQSERIAQLAKNLKDLHLASSHEEAFARAKEIVLGTPQEGTEQSVKQLMDQAGMTEKDLSKAKQLLKEEEQALRELKQELTDLKAKHLEDDMHHGEHEKETKELDEDLVNAEHDVGVVEENIDMAEKVQDKD